MTEITVVPVLVFYRYKKEPLISNEVFVRKGATLPFKQGNVTIIAGATADRQFPFMGLSPIP